MAVQYRGTKPERNYTLKDFYDNGVVISWGVKFKDTKGNPALRVILRSNGLLGEIRTCNYDKECNYAVDVKWAWGEGRCLTTECKSIREAKSILFQWFKEKGFYVPKSVTDTDWRKGDLAYHGIQLKFSPFIFRD